MRTALALIAAAASLALAVPAAIAADPTPTQDAPAAAKPPADCFFLRDVRNQTVGGDHVVFFNVRNRDTYRVDVAGPCLAAASSSDHVDVQSRGTGGQICNKLDLDIRVHGGRCIVEDVHKMTQQEIAAMPRHSDPQGLTPAFHLKPVFGRPQ